MAVFEWVCVRVFDVGTTALVQVCVCVCVECRQLSHLSNELCCSSVTQDHLQHRAEVTQIVFAPDGTRMYSGGADGGLCVYDVTQVYQPTKFLPSGARDLRVSHVVQG